MHQRGHGLFARRADAEVRPGRDHCTGLDLTGKLRAHGFQAMRCDALDAQLHVGARCQRIGINIRAEFPDAMNAHAITSRGSEIRPRKAEAATV